MRKSVLLRRRARNVEHAERRDGNTNLSARKAGWANANPRRANKKRARSKNVRDWIEILL